LDYKTEAPPPSDVLSSIPEGENIIWSGKPDFKSITLRAFGLKYLLFYLLISFVFFSIRSGIIVEPIKLITSFVPYLLSGILICCIVSLFSYFQVRNTVYVVTDKRVVIKTGVALIFMLNVPFEKISEINRQILGDGSGNISFKLISGKRVPFFASWPSVRPWYFSNPEPTFRYVADADLVATDISRAAASKIHQVNKKLTQTDTDSKSEQGALV
jgi:hypothetical protein